MSTSSISNMDTKQLQKFVSQQCKFLSVGDALKLFDEMRQRRPFPSVISFCQILTAITKTGHHSTVVSLSSGKWVCFESQLISSLLNVAINCYCRLGRVDYVFSLLGAIIKRGFIPDTVIYGTLIDGLGKSGHVIEALKLFKYMKKDHCVPQVVQYSAMIVLGFLTKCAALE